MVADAAAGDVVAVEGDFMKNTGIGYDDPMKYVGIFRRVGAALVDFVVLLPILAILFWATSYSRTAALIVYFPLTLLMTAYRVYFTGRWGQTLGKKAMGIKVVQVNGQEVGFTRAIYRDSVNIAISLVSGTLLFVALLSLPSVEFDALKLGDKYLRIMAATPPWGHKFNSISNWWSLPNALILLFNAKRRAVHDFVAGTVVVYVDKSAIVVGHDGDGI